MSEQNNFLAHVPVGTPPEQYTTAQKYDDICLINVEDIPTIRAKLQQRQYTPMQINGVIRFLLEYNWEIIHERALVELDLKPIV